MKISFVIPAFNEEKYIGRCLDSVLREIRSSACDAEVIVVNNASTDDTSRIAAAHGGVRVVEEKRKGLLHARQKGYLESRGDLIACIDADSILPAGWIDTVMGFFSTSPRLVCLSGPYVYDDLSPALRILVVLWYLVSVIVLTLVCQYVLRRAALVQGGNYVVRKSALTRAGGHDTSIAFYGEDIELALRLVKIGVVWFSFRLPLHTSARRIRREGMFRTAINYAANGLAVAVRGRPLTQRYTDVREG